MTIVSFIHVGGRENVLRKQLDLELQFSILASFLEVVKDSSEDRFDYDFLHIAFYSYREAKWKFMIYRSP